jgi:hypothetical protein
MPIQTIWIIGGGRFGLKAADALGRLQPDAHLTLIDPNPEIARRLPDGRIVFVCQDGVDYLAQHLSRENTDWIVPAAPVHVAFLWMLQRLKGLVQAAPIPVPDAVAALVPNPFRGASGELYISNADFLCPDNCPEPADICSHTGQPRPRTLFRFLSQISPAPFHAIVVRSRQLCPGVGGFRPRTLFEALEQVQSIRGSLLFSTACRCHGVMNAMTVSEI